MSETADGPTGQRPSIVLVAGEASGDHLAAQLIVALRQRLPNARFAGIAGPRMIAAGCEAWERAEQLSVMGLFEILPHLPRLLRIRRQLIDRLLATPPDVYIGVDAKEFNLRLMPALKARGIRTVQYVSPQIWAWRQGRIRTIGRAVDLVLCLLPFEKQFYDAHAVNARFVGHPLADLIPMQMDRTLARQVLGLAPDAHDAQTIALLPGSRAGEVARLGPPFAATVRWLGAQRPQLRFIAAMASRTVRERFEESLRAQGVRDQVQLFDGRAQEVMAASDAVLLASGTATLEALLVKRPMVVAYRLGALTTFLLKTLKLVKSPFFAQPNLLAGRALVPEFFNAQVRPKILGAALIEQLDRTDGAALLQTFAAIHGTLRRGASGQAADAIVELLQKQRSE